MDLNRLYFEHQLALMRASCAKDPPASARLSLRAGNIMRRIAHLRQRNGAEAGELTCQL